MNIFTERVKNQHYSQPIQASLLKHSQEYRVLATLRYLFPQKYNKMAAKESPDLQDFENSIGVEVTAAVREDDMRATRAFSQFCRASSNRERQKNKTQIESSGYSIVPIQGSRLAISTTGTSNGEKNFFQKNVRKKIAKLRQYRKNFNVLGLAIVLLEIPTLEAESHFIDWICEVFREGDDLFDFVYVLSSRFCIYYDAQADHFQKQSISREEHTLLCTIARMTAEGELTLDDQEWQ